MKEIVTQAKIVAPIGLSGDSRPRLAVDFGDVAKQLDEISERFPSHSKDEVKIVILIDQRGDKIYGHPVEYRCKNEPNKNRN